MSGDNSVELCGVVASEPLTVELAEADRIEFRLSVPRTESGADSINCFVVDPKLAVRVGKLAEGRRVQISGELRSRFWRSGGRTSATMEVEVQRLRLA